MEYRIIVYEGYANPISRKNLKDYFIRQYRNAEKENYSIGEFFDGCLNEILIMEEKFEHNFQVRLGQLAMALDEAEEQNDSKRIKHITKQMKYLDKENYPLYKTNHSEWLFIKKQIEEARFSLQPKKKSKQIIKEPLNFELNQSQVIYLFDILQKAGFLNEPKFHEGSYYRKLESYFTANKIPIKDAEQKRQKYLDKPLKTSEDMKKALLKALQKI